jgi:hypothetical protein
MRVLALGLALLCAAGALLIPAPGRAAPVVKVKARTQIIMEPVQRGWSGVEVRGRVVDRFNGQPVPGVEVQVRMNDATHRARTDDKGTFSTTFDVADGRYEVAVEYGGGEYFTESEMELGVVDISKQSVELEVRASDVAYSKRTVEVEIRATVARVGVTITTDLFLGSSKGEIRHAGRVTTDDSGRGTINLDRDLLGEPGRKTIQARFLGSRAFNPAEAQADFLLATDTAITFSLTEDAIAYESKLTGTGRVTDKKGRGLAGAPVAMMVGARRVAQTLTSEHGEFRLRVSGSEIGAGKFNIQAVFEPNKPWHRTSRSELAQVQIAQPQPVPVAYTLAAFGATALAMMAFLGLRAKPWQGWLARLQRRESETGARDQDPAEPPRITHGLSPARPSLVSTLRRPHELDFSGTVRDAVSSRTVAECQIALDHDHDRDHDHDHDHDHAQASPRSVITDGAGHFAFDELEPGQWQARVSARGYVTELFAISIPHRGELRGARIDLLPVREQIFSLYRDVAQPLLPKRELWGIWTPRQIFDHVREHKPASALSDVTDFVEDTYFSARTPEESILDEARALLDRARAELDRSAEPVPQAE